ncbi:MAG: hypothetical protein K0U78_21005 [Actinomycetia bacterium]|nr:hypothetical protein [Actinomycetes bacterium]
MEDLIEILSKTKNVVFNNLTWENRVTKKHKHFCCVCQKQCLFAMQAKCGAIFCGLCNTENCCEKKNCALNTDKRIRREMSDIITDCLFRDKGCEHTCDMSSYKNHIMKQCPYPITECEICSERVVWKHMKTHQETQSCKTFDVTQRYCCYGCGFKTSNWIMPFHHKVCACAPIACILGKKCKNETRSHISIEDTASCHFQHLDYILDISDTQNIEFRNGIVCTFMKDEETKAEFYASPVFLLQNNIPVELYMSRSNIKHQFELKLTSTENDDIFSEAMMTVGILDKCTNGDVYTQDMENVYCGNENTVVFSNSRFINAAQFMMSPDEGGRDFCSDGKCIFNLKITFRHECYIF